MKKDTDNSIYNKYNFCLGTVKYWQKRSQIVSDTLLDIIKPLEEIKPDEIHTAVYEYYNHLVRKFVHIVEFSLIGVELALIFRMFGEKKDVLIVFVNALLAGQMIGLIDETYRYSHAEELRFRMYGLI